MSILRINAVVAQDGVLHVDGLPCRRGDRVEGTLQTTDQATIAARDEARRRFLERCRQSQFYSTGPYPTRDQAHERH